MLQSDVCATLPPSCHPLGVNGRSGRTEKGNCQWQVDGTGVAGHAIACRQTRGCEKNAHSKRPLAEQAPYFKVP